MIIGCSPLLACCVGEGTKLLPFFSELAAGKKIKCDSSFLMFFVSGTPILRDLKGWTVGRFPFCLPWLLLESVSISLYGCPRAFNGFQVDPKHVGGSGVQSINSWNGRDRSFLVVMLQGFDLERVDRYLKPFAKISRPRSFRCKLASAPGFRNCFRQEEDMELLRQQSLQSIMCIRPMWARSQWIWTRAMLLETCSWSWSSWHWLSWKRMSTLIHWYVFFGLQVDDLLFYESNELSWASCNKSWRVMSEIGRRKT